MNIYFAPMEGITGYIFRNRFNQYFGKHIDRYFTPFIQAHEKCGLTSKEVNDILPEHNNGINLIPQVMTNKASEYFQIEPLIMDYGYTEINLNFGCPSKTVTSRHRGSGILSELDMIDNLLYEIFDKGNCSISVKTRIGIDDPQEFDEILPLYNKYELSELIIHPRVQKQFYSGTVCKDSFMKAVEESKNLLIYNGDIFTPDNSMINDACQIDNCKGIMLGRGLIKNPSLVNEIYGENKLDKKDLLNFLTDVCNDYCEVLSGDVPVLHKMKEIWNFITMDLGVSNAFDYDNKLYKKMIKSKSIKEFLINQKCLIEAL